MSCKFKYKGEELTEGELIAVLSSDPKIIKKYGTKLKNHSKTYSRETLDVFNEKVKQLQKAMNVRVILDDSIEISKVLAKGDKRTKEAGKPVIVVNPERLFGETAVHEFAHIFIDSFPKGLQNPRIQKALAQLEGTDLAAEVEALYPDLSPEMLAKEKIATAMGREGADLWESADDVSAWQTFVDWFKDYINRTFNIPTNEIQSMTRDILGGQDLKLNLLTGLSSSEQELRENPPNQVEETKSSSLQTVYNEVLARVTNAYNEYLPRTLDEINRETMRSYKTQTTRFEGARNLKDELKRLDTVDQQLGLSMYVDWVRGEIKALEDNLNMRVEADKLTDEKIVASIRWNNAFSTIEDIQNLTQTLYNTGELSKKDKKYYDRVLKDIQGKRSLLQSRLLQAGRESYAQFIAANDNETENRYKEKYEKEFKDQGLAEAGQNELEYVREKLLENTEEIKEEAYAEALARSESINGDISSFAAAAFSEKNANSKDIQVLSKIVDEADRQIDRHATETATRFQKNNLDYKKNISKALKQSEKYKGMMEETDNGQHYFASAYSAEFQEIKSEMHRTAGDQDMADEKYKEVTINSEDMTYTIDGRTEKLAWYGAGKLTTVEGGLHVTYEQGGEVVSITKELAIAKTEVENWIDRNTTKIISGGALQYIPTDNWINDNYAKLSDAEKTQLEWFKNEIKLADKDTAGAGTLIKASYGQEWIKLPAIQRTDVQRLAEGNIKDFVTHKAQSITKRQKDDFETAEGDGRTFKDSMRVLADISNREKRTVPIAYRAKLESADQSLDLHTITLMNSIAAREYKEKKALEAQFLIVLEVMKTRKVQDTAGFARLRKIHAMSEKDAEIALYKDVKDGLYNDAKKVMDMMENRIYGIKNKDAGEIAGVNIQQATKSWLKYSGTVALLGNLANSVINYNMGNASNFMEAMGGEHFGLRDLVKARKTYWLDIKGVMNDMGGTKVNTSRTNLFMNMFNVAGGREFLDNKFEETTRFQSLLKINNLRPIAKGGEHMMQSQLMYAVMHGIKVMNKDGKYIDKDGKLVKNKKEAVSLDAMIEFITDKKTGEIKMELSPLVGATSFTLTGGKEQILLETRNLIKNKVMELHGNYDSDLQAAAQREFWGKLIYFLRKWTLPGIHRRWRGFGSSLKKSEDLTEADKFYSQDAKANREGYYATATRFISNVLFPAIKTLNMELIKQGTKELSAHEKANLYKVLTELSMIAISMLAYAALDGDDDEDKNLMAKYMLRRQTSELSFFLNPVESFKIVSTPTASVGTAKRILQVITQSLDPFAEYQQGSNKGRNKWTVKALKAFPITSQTEKNIKDSLKFLNQMSF